MHKKANVISQSELGGRGIFYVGGKVKGDAGKKYIGGQMFVEVYVPKDIKQPYPIIFFHGAGQTNVNWLITPDGRKGWADYFVEQGYIVYLAEQPSRGRSPYHFAEEGHQIYHSLETLEERFTSDKGKWPQAKKHTRWPKESPGFEDSLFQAFAKSQMEYLPSNKRTQQLVMACAEELLSITGPSILMTHSQAGPFGWNILDAYPDMVKGIVALEPSGPPFSTDLSNSLALNYGISELPLHFAPPVDSPKDFHLMRLDAQKPDFMDGWVMETPYQLPGFKDTPILLLVGEASYHAQYDHLVSYFFTQAGVAHDFIRLEEVGITGNGHMMMLEVNNLEIAEWIHGWISTHVAIK